MTDATVMVRPRRGLILDGIPRKGAAIPAALAEEWIRDQLVERVPEPPTPEAKKPPVRRRPSPRGSGASRPVKRRRTK